MRRQSQADQADPNVVVLGGDLRLGELFIGVGKPHVGKYVTAAAYEADLFVHVCPAFLVMCCGRVASSVWKYLERRQMTSSIAAVGDAGRSAEVSF